MLIRPGLVSDHSFRYWGRYRVKQDAGIRIDAYILDQDKSTPFSDPIDRLFNQFIRERPSVVCQSFCENESLALFNSQIRRCNSLILDYPLFLQERSSLHLAGLI